MNVIIAAVTAALKATLAVGPAVPVISLQGPVLGRPFSDFPFHPTFPPSSTPYVGRSST